MRSGWALAPLLLCQLGYSQGVIAIYPAPVSVVKGTTQNFLTYITVSPNTVTWSVNGVDGGSPMLGTVTTSVLYTAPATIPTSNVVKVRATSTAKPAIFGESVVTISQ